MASRESVYRKLYLRELLRFKGSPEGSFVDSLRDSNYVPSQGAKQKELIYELSDGAFLPFCGLTADISRWCLLLVETLLDLERSKHKKSLAWRFIKAYYAAYFSIQVISRMTGQWPVKLKNLESFTEVFKIYHGKNPEISTDIFLCQFESPDKFKCFPFQFNGNASHKSTWLIFSVCLERLINFLLVGQDPDEIEVAGDFAKLLSDLGGTTTPNFLSNFRNELNYQMGFGIWYPQTPGAQRDWEIYHKLLDFDLSLDAAPVYIQRNNSTQQKFLGCCNFIINFALWMMNDLSSMHPQNKFLKQKYQRLVESLQ